MAAPNLITNAVVMPYINHGRTIPFATLLEETALAATKTEDHIDTGGPFGAMTMTLEVTAADGTLPTLDVIVQHSVDGDTWATLGGFTQVTTTPGSETKTFGPCSQYIRGKATITGTDVEYAFTLSGPCDISFV
jgi:hypothetical protein